MPVRISRRAEWPGNRARDGGRMEMYRMVRAKYEYAISNVDGGLTDRPVRCGEAIGSCCRRPMHRGRHLMNSAAACGRSSHSFIPYNYIRFSSASSRNGLSKARDLRRQKHSCERDDGVQVQAEDRGMLVRQPAHRLHGAGGQASKIRESKHSTSTAAYPSHGGARCPVAIAYTVSRVRQ